MFKGYLRTEEQTSKLLGILQYLLKKYPSQRLGQLIVNVCSDFDYPDTYKGKFFASALFNVYDEDLYRRLEVFDEWQEFLKQETTEGRYSLESPDWVTYWEEYKKC